MVDLMLYVQLHAWCVLQAVTVYERVSCACIIVGLVAHHTVILLCGGSTDPQANFPYCRCLQQQPPSILYLKLCSCGCLDYYFWTLTMHSLRLYWLSCNSNGAQDSDAHYHFWSLQ